MTDEETPDTGEVTESEPSVQEAVGQLRDLFATLVPPDRLELQDALGNRYTTRAVLPARSQIKVMQTLSDLWDLEVNAPGTDVSSVIGLLVKLAGNPVVLDGMCEAFQTAHPKVVESAQTAAKSEGLEWTHPGDLFPVEELVAGLVPFFIRFAHRAANLMEQVTTPKS